MFGLEGFQIPIAPHPRGRFAGVTRLVHLRVLAEGAERGGFFSIVPERLLEGGIPTQSPEGLHRLSKFHLLAGHSERNTKNADIFSTRLYGDMFAVSGRTGSQLL